MKRGEKEVEDVRLANDLKDSILLPKSNRLDSRER